jgi:hypothetical protein
VSENTVVTAVTLAIRESGSKRAYFSHRAYGAGTAHCAPPAAHTHKHICTCVYVCVHVCVHVYVHVCVHVYVHVSVCMYGCICVCMCGWVGGWVGGCACVHMGMCVCVYVCVPMGENHITVHQPMRHQWQMQRLAPTREAQIKRYLRRRALFTNMVQHHDKRLSR